MSSNTPPPKTINMEELIERINNPDIDEIEAKETQIRELFLPKISPTYFISYKNFCDNFEPHLSKNFKEENLNIIDMHLKYRQFVYEEMAPYKWLPITGHLIFRLLNRKAPLLLFPLAYTYFFDYYMEPYFAWLHKDDRIINVREEFATKLSKFKNKKRRVKLYESLKEEMMMEGKTALEQEQIQKPETTHTEASLSFSSLKESSEKNEPTLSSSSSSSSSPFSQTPSSTSSTSSHTSPPLEIPHRYLKFGEPTEYIFHSSISSDTTEEISTILQTGLFQTYMNITNINFETIFNINNIKKQFKLHWQNFSKYKKDQNKTPYYLNPKQLLKFKEVQEDEISELSAKIEKRIRRITEIFFYHKTKAVYFSEFTFDNMFYSYQHKHLTAERKYTIETYEPDIALYYSVVLVPFALIKIFKR